MWGVDGRGRARVPRESIIDPTVVSSTTVVDVFFFVHIEAGRLAGWLAFERAKARAWLSTLF